jgi:hypothetical protein
MFFLLSFVDCRLIAYFGLRCEILELKVVKRASTRQKTNVRDTEERRHACTTFLRIVLEHIFAVFPDVISLARTSGRVPMAHLISEKALDLHAGTDGQMDVRASYSETNGRFRLCEMRRHCESCA